jgi:hypothetical protein
MKEIAEKLQAAGTIRIPKIEINDDITKMAESIFNRGADSRTQEEVFRDCKRIAIEFALVKVLGGERNPKEFNFKDKDSYIWDVMVDGKKFEVKRLNILLTRARKSVLTLKIVWLLIIL